MSIFIDTLTDEDGKPYEYGHCFQDYDDGRPDTGCGMEYAYYADDERLDRWHDAVGLVTRTTCTPEQRAALDTEHATCHTEEI